MTRNEYLINLAVELEKCGGMGADEIKRTVEFCREMMDDMMEEGMSEEQAVSSMGEPSDIAARMTEEASREDIDDAVMPEENFGGSQRVRRVFDAAQVKEISVTEENNGILMAGGNELSVEFDQDEDSFYTAEVVSGVLVVKYFDRRRKLGLLQRIFSHTARRDRFVVTVPESWTGGAELRTSNASVEVENVRLSGINVHTGNGRVELENVQVKESAELKTSNGRVTLEKVGAGDITAKTSNGRIAAKDVHAAGNVTLVTSNGRVTAEMLSAGDAVLSTSNGRVEVAGIDAENIRLASSNGGISGTVAGRREDYRISSRTSNGKNNLGSTDAGARRLEVITSNAGIDVSFE